MSYIKVNDTDLEKKKKLSKFKHIPYSLSKLEAFKTCNKKFRYQYIDKVKVPSDNTALLKGSLAHWIIQTKLCPLPKEVNHSYKTELSEEIQEEVKTKCNKFFKSTLFKEIKSITILGTEVQFALDINLQPCDYWSNEAIIRGSIDFVGTKDGELYLLDWKTGKVKDKKYIPKNHQLTLYSIWASKIFNFKKINTRYIYVEHESQNIFNYDVESLTQYAKLFGKDIKDVESEELFSAKVGKLCPWCDYRELCEEYKETL